jgi:hypothetical protein
VCVLLLYWSKANYTSVFVLSRAYPVHPVHPVHPAASPWRLPSAACRHRRGGVSAGACQPACVRLVIESWWLQPASECQRSWHPPRLNRCARPPSHHLLLGASLILGPAAQATPPSPPAGRWCRLPRGGGRRRQRPAQGGQSRAPVSVGRGGCVSWAGRLRQLGGAAASVGWSGRVCCSPAGRLGGARRAAAAAAAAA